MQTGLWLLIIFTVLVGGLLYLQHQRLAEESTPNGQAALSANAAAVINVATEAKDDAVVPDEGSKSGANDLRAEVLALKDIVDKHEKMLRYVMERYVEKDVAAAPKEGALKGTKQATVANLSQPEGLVAAPEVKGEARAGDAPRKRKTGAPDSSMVGMPQPEAGEVARNQFWLEHPKRNPAQQCEAMGGGGDFGKGGKGKGKKGKGKGKGKGKQEEKQWAPMTKLGRLVNDGKINNLEEIYLHSLPIKEPEIIDHFYPPGSLKDDVLKIHPVQKMTSAGQTNRFVCYVLVGDTNGHIGLGSKCAKEVATAIRGGIIAAKLNLIPVRRGFWGNRIGLPHTVPMKVHGKCGSVRARLIPAPRGSGIVGSPVMKKMMAFAGISDCFTCSCGHTRTTANFAKATFEALKATYGYLTPDLWKPTSHCKSPFQAVCGWVP
eukprot:symbB.v1.2.023068.t1/scaffold2086.1/size90009/5